MADKKFLDEDGVSQFAEETKKYVDKHADNADIHVTATDKSNWNGKQDALTAEQLAAVNSGISATDKGNYDAHIANADIHVTAADKANWNGKQDALTSQQIDNINDVVNKANASDLTAHTNNSDIHVTAADKANWNGKQNALTAQQLSNIADVVNKANASDLTAHTNNADIHVTTSDKTRWNGKQNALSTAQLNACNSGITSTKVATYDGYASAISSKANASDLTAHIANTDIHVTTSDKTRWNAKQDALTSQQLSNIADVVNKANDSDVVHKTGDETITGNKIFSGTTKIDGYEITFADNRTTNVWGKIPVIRENDGLTELGQYVDFHATRNDTLDYCVRLRAIDSATPTAGKGELRFTGGSITPNTTNSTYLGSSSLKWKDVNTVLLNGKVPAYAADLSAVATSGSYNDLSDKPTIPTVNNATLTIQKNGTTVKTFTANASANVTANIVVPTKTSELTNDSGFLTTHNPVDNALSSTSTNAVQNKVVNTALNAKANDSAVVHKSGAETVAGVKTFNDGIVSNLINSKTPELIEEQGSNYIRYSNGIQICYGTIVTTTQLMPVTFAKPFSNLISYGITALGSIVPRVWLSGERTATNVTLETDSPDGAYRRVDWVAIGVWK